MKFGPQYYNSPSPTYIKIIFYMLLMYATYLFMNVDSLPSDNVKLKEWLKYLSVPTIGLIAFLKDMFGISSPPDSANQPTPQS